MAELNIPLSFTSEAGPRLPDMISEDSPNSSADTPSSGSSDERSAGRTVRLPARRDMSWPPPRASPGDDLVDVELAKADSLSFCLNRVSSSSVPTRRRQ